MVSGCLGGKYGAADYNFSTRIPVVGGFAADATLSKYFLLFGLIFTIVLYNRSGYPQYYENSLYTSLFKVIIYLLSLLWFALSCKWFLIEDRSSLGFYALCLSSLAALSIMISSLYLGVMAAAWLLISLFNFCLLRLSPETEETGAVCRNYLLSVLFFGLLFGAGCVLLWQACGSLDYGSSKAEKTPKLWPG